MSDVPYEECFLAIAAATAPITPPTSMGVGRGITKRSTVSVSVCRVPQPNWTTEKPRKPKIVMMEAHCTSNP